MSAVADTLMTPLLRKVQRGTFPASEAGPASATADAQPQAPSERLQPVGLPTGILVVPQFGEWLFGCYYFFED